MAAEKYQRTVGYPSTSWASCLFFITFSEKKTAKPIVAKLQ